MTDSCSTCKFWSDSNCCRFAPTGSVLVSISPMTESAWLPTASTDWCGEFSAVARSTLEACGNCKFYIEDRCHEQAPTVAGGSWAAVNPADWCGEYQRGSAFVMRPMAGAYSATVGAAILRSAIVLKLQPETYSLTGKDVDLQPNQSMGLAAGTHSISGQNLELKATFVMRLGAGSYSINAADLGLFPG